MNENINLIEILKDAPKGTKLYSPFCGECEFCGLLSDDKIRPIQIRDSISGTLFRLTSYGKFFVNQEAECLLFPSKNHCDWSTFKAPWKHKHFEPFQKVLVSCYFGNVQKHIWCADLYSHFDKNSNKHCVVGNRGFSDDEILPYEGNEDKLGKPIK